MEKKNSKIYNIGLDIGTNSVGYSVTDMNNDLIKFKGQNFWGVRLFEEGKTAAVRRSYRSNRRRKLRQKQRIQLLQEFLEIDIQKVDENFYFRLKESFKNSNQRSNHFNIFIEDNFNDINLYKKYPTIYHLRNDLINSNKKFDIRLIYLALHHIIKYRGNFLYEGQTFTTDSTKINDDVKLYFDFLQDSYLGEFNITEQDIIDYINTISSTSINKKDKLKYVPSFAKDQLLIKAIKEFNKAVLGNKADFSIILLHEEKISELNLSLSSEYDEDVVESLLADDYDKFSAIQRIYSTLVLKEIRGNYINISDSMIAKYNKHKTDLSILKKLIKEYYNESYDSIFRDITHKYNSYSSYITHHKKTSREDLYKYLKGILTAKNDILEKNEDYRYCTNEMDNDNFLKIINIKENGAIPYQLHKDELIKILNNQAEYYESIRNNIDKIISILEFRIPYYIGPLNHDKVNQFSWMQRKDNEKGIFPWNFHEKVDVEKSAEKFIRRMTNKCTYLLTEDVLPKKSLLICEYELLDELNKVRINEKLIPFETKIDIIDRLFKRQKKVNYKTLESYYKTYLNVENISIKGLKKENSFAASLDSYIDFTNILGIVNIDNIDMIENIILWITIFTDKKILKSKIISEYPNITEEQMKKILKLNYSGWSRFSKKLLNGIMVKDKKCNKITIIDRMRLTNDNFMQIINDQELGFNKKIEEYSKKTYNDKLTIDEVKQLPGSPAIKKAIWQTIKLVDEIKYVMGTDPNKIYIEVTRSNGKSQRTSSRVNKLLKLYEIFKTEYKDFSNEVYDQLKNEKKNNSKLDNEKLFLYYLQNGKCMYCNERLELDKLNLYEVDHILPRSLIKDDSIENKVLVHKHDNQNKGDNLLLNQNVITNKSGFWNYLYKCGLMTSKKYNNLMRTSITDNDVEKFINRQLVETSQIIINVANLLNNYYKNTDVSIVKAQLTSSLRKELELYKIRELNDYHHAHDAFLTTIIGSFTARFFNSYNYGEYLKYKVNKKYTSGLIISVFKDNKFNLDGEIIWEGPKEISKIRKYLNYKDCYVSRKCEEQTGEFYNQTLYNKNEAKVEIKKGLDPKIYGGYTNINEAYGVIVEYIKGKKKIRELVSISILEASLINNNQNSLLDILKTKLDVNDVKILREKVLKNQLALYNENLVYIASTQEITNAKQLTIDSKYTKLVYELTHKLIEKNDENHDLLNEFYSYLQNKINSHYQLYLSLADRFNQSYELFIKLEFEKKCKFLIQMLSITSPYPASSNFKEFNMPLLKERQDRIRKKLDINKLILIDKSVTGIFIKKEHYEL